jgi:hypothetical protein
LLVAPGLAVGVILKSVMLNAACALDAVPANATAQQTNAATARSSALRMLKRALELAVALLMAWTVI